MADSPSHLQSGTTLDDAFALINNNFANIDADNRTKVIKDGNTPILLMGYQNGGFNGGSFGLKIAKPGFDVTTTPDTNLAFSSAFDSLRVVGSGTLSVAVPSPPGTANAVWTAQVAHGLGYAPAFIAYVTQAGLAGAVGNQPVPYYFLSYNTGLGTNGFLVSVAATVSTDTTNVYFTVLTGANAPINSGTYAAKYYLLQETAN